MLKQLENVTERRNAKAANLENKKDLRQLSLKDRKRRPKGGEWEPQISFEIFDHCPNINPQKAYTKDLMTTTLEKGGCSLRTQRVTTEQTEHRSKPKRANSQKKTALLL